MTCENCGLPEGATNSKGLTVRITRPAENSYQRERKSTVWVCSEECGVQALAISEYGPASSKWPVGLSKLRSILKRKLCQLKP